MAANLDLVLGLWSMIMHANLHQEHFQANIVHMDGWHEHWNRMGMMTTMMVVDMIMHQLHE